MMLDLFLGAGVGIAAIVGVLIGIRIGKGSGKAEAQALRDRIGSLETERARLDGLMAA